MLEETPDTLDVVGAQASRLQRYGAAHPAVELGLRWLERHRPTAGRPVFLHGDFRLGNFLVAPEGITAVLDWKCAHIGCGAEDLGWLCTRAWRFGRVETPVGGFGTRQQLQDAYAAVTGIRHTPEETRYWEVFGLVRWAVISIMQAHQHTTGAQRSLVFAATGRNVCLVEYDLLMTLCGRYS